LAETDAAICLRIDGRMAQKSFIHINISKVAGQSIFDLRVTRTEYIIHCRPWFHRSKTLRVLEESLWRLLREPIIDIQIS